MAIEDVAIASCSIDKQDHTTLAIQLSLIIIVLIGGSGEAIMSQLIKPIKCRLLLCSFNQINSYCDINTS